MSAMKRYVRTILTVIILLVFFKGGRAEEYRTDATTDAVHQKFHEVITHKTGEEKSGVVLTRLNRDRVTSHMQAFQKDLVRKSRFQHAAWGTLGVAGIGLASYGAYKYFVPSEHNINVLDQFSKLTPEQRQTWENAELQAKSQYYKELEKRYTFSGHIKHAAWYGAEMAIGTFMCGFVLSLFTKGQEFTKGLLPALFVNDKEKYEILYEKVKNHFSRLYQTLRAFSMHDENGAYTVHSNILYGHFCGQIVADYTALVYALEMVTSFLFVYGSYHDVQSLESIRQGVDIIDDLIQEFACALEQIINRVDGRSFERVGGLFTTIHVNVIQFMCTSGEALYGDAFSPV